MRWHQRRVHGECQSATTVIMISSRSLAFFALMAVVAFAAAMPQPEAEAEAEAQRFYGNNNYYSSNYGYPSYYRGYYSGYGNNGFYGNNYNNYNNYHGNSGNRGFYNGNSCFW